VTKIVRQTKVSGEGREKVGTNGAAKKQNQFFFKTSLLAKWGILDGDGRPSERSAAEAGIMHKGKKRNTTPTGTT